MGKIPSMCDKLLLTVVEAARQLGLGRSKTYTLIQRGSLPSIKIDGSRRILAADVVEFVRHLAHAEPSDD
jgi:excisionase family DNA binding protein